MCISESFFSLLGNIPLHEYITVCLSTDGHLGSLQDLKIMDKTAMNILAQPFIGEFGYLFTTSIDMSCRF